MLQGNKQSTLGAVGKALKVINGRRPLERVEAADRGVEVAIFGLRKSFMTPEGQAALKTLADRRQAFDQRKTELVKLVLAQSLDEGSTYLIKDVLPPAVYRKIVKTKRMSFTVAYSRSWKGAESNFPI